MEKLMGQMKSQIISALRKEIPDASEIFWTKFEQKMDVNELLEKLMPIYDKYYTLEDLKAVNYQKTDIAPFSDGTFYFNIARPSDFKSYSINLVDWYGVPELADEKSN